MPKKKLLLYTPVAHRDGCRLKEALATVVAQQATEEVHTPQGLAGRLSKPASGLKVAVLLAAGRGKLRELQALDRMLESLRLILILPDTAPDTIAQAHSLRPRYVTDIHSDFQDVCAVLRKMLVRPKPPKSPRPAFG